VPVKKGREEKLKTRHSEILNLARTRRILSPGGIHAVCPVLQPPTALHTSSNASILAPLGREEKGVPYTGSLPEDAATTNDCIGAPKALSHVVVWGLRFPEGEEEESSGTA